MYANSKTKQPVKQPKVALSFELLTTTTAKVVAYWTETKLFSTKADKQSLLIVNSHSTYRSIINSRYHINGNSEVLEDIYGTEFTKDVVSNVMQELLTGRPVHTPVTE